MTLVEQLEGQLANAKELVDRRKEALKLGEVRLFRKLILEEFCEKEAARMAALSADPALNAEQRADALALAQAGGHLKRWLSMQVQMGAVSERQLPELEEAIEEARREEAEDAEAAEADHEQTEA